MMLDIAQDRLGAFCVPLGKGIAATATGPLTGTTFAAKDLFDVAGQRTGAGNPDWLRTHEPATTTAPAIAALLAAGSDFVGKTHTDELAFSLNGENAHYGTPVNPAAPGRIPGGSSSGSAVAVAGGLVDTALGTDTGGSVRMPASYCGIYGMRPTHGAITVAGVVPLAPSFDTVGWFARDAEMLARVGQVLLPAVPAKPIRSVLFATDALDLLDAVIADALSPILKGLRFDGEVAVSSEGLSSWLPVFRTLQAREVWTVHGDWIERTTPSFGPGIAERFAWAAGISDDQVAVAEERRSAIRRRLDSLLGPGVALCLPTAPGIAPLLNLPAEELEHFRNRALSLTCIAGLGGVPQISVPLGTYNGCPIGISFIGARGSDRALLDLIQNLPLTKS